MAQLYTLDIYGIGLILSAISSIVFILQDKKDKALISFIIFLAIMLLKFLLGD